MATRLLGLLGVEITVGFLFWSLYDSAELNLLVIAVVLLHLCNYFPAHKVKVRKDREQLNNG